LSYAPKVLSLRDLRQSFLSLRFSTTPAATPVHNEDRPARRQRAGQETQQPVFEALPCPKLILHPPAPLASLPSPTMTSRCSRMPPGPVKAMILLGINCGMGNADCAVACSTTRLGWSSSATERNDQVGIAESEAMAQILPSDIHVEVILFPDDGHGAGPLRLELGERRQAG